MDILDQYNKEKLSALRTPKMVSWVFKHSGGTLKTERQAAYVLLVLACFIGLSAVFLLIKGIRGPYTQSGPGLTTQELEEYKKIQPF